MATVAELDAIADRLGAIYQMAGRLMPDDNSDEWVALLDEIVAVTSALESASGRTKRERKARKRLRKLNSPEPQKVIPIGSRNAPCNHPFARVPQCACDPGHGEPPPWPCPDCSDVSDFKALLAPFGSNRTHE